MKTPPHHSDIEIKIESVDQLREQFKQTQGWLFRGHRCAHWQLEPTVVRCARRNGLNVSTFEQRCFKDFTRRAHDYFPFRPHDDSTAEWLGWMQHYSAPTRIVDVTKSPWVATFFAVEELECPETGNESCAAIWAIQPNLIEQKNPNGHRDRNALLGFLVDPERWKEKKKNDTNLPEPTLDFDNPRVELMLPHLIPERLSRQKGEFLFAFELERPACLKLVELAKKWDGQLKEFIRKLLIPYSLRADLMKELALINIDADTLFPGPDGFGRSLRSLMLRN